MLREIMQETDILILGAGWTAGFLIPQLQQEGITYAATTTSGRDNTIPFKFDPESGSAEPYKRLPSARTILVTFPLRGHGQSKAIVGLYRAAHGAKNNWIQLGATTIFNKLPNDWSDDNAPYDKHDIRAIAEDELLGEHGCVLDLSGLYGGERVPSKWLPRLAKNKEDVKKRGAVHFIHGEDVARAIIATHRKFTHGKRWIISDMRVYDWYDLIMSFSAMAEGLEASAQEQEERLQFANWVGELMIEEGIRALPRDMHLLGRKLDSRGFWQFHGVWPRHQRLC
ncbi:hypothetical protein C7974DRAFT_395519 [Boeremia exigua]|uniref:uncharacterized protein n=1 Tax=Boeremia exigua TaxID=749465 RepID=UPI001E8EB862|nr:uncharacterized protein C7974DRAFT_395519 [Boeremia exigua]KAH6625152.1 hypothetical protein C7974DRAFT_395519 [Boeremia exigua]